ncbi:MAG TPA: hypothetical protein VIC30_02770, partial [Orrella sp.]
MPGNTATGNTASLPRTRFHPKIVGLALIGTIDGGPYVQQMRHNVRETSFWLRFLAWVVSDVVSLLCRCFNQLNYF